MNAVKIEGGGVPEITENDYRMLVDAGRYHKARTGNEWTSFRLVLWDARSRFRTSPVGGRPKTGTNDPVFSWDGYCKDVGVPKRTANRILKCFEEQLTARGISADAISEITKEEIVEVLASPVLEQNLLEGPTDNADVMRLEKELQKERQLRIDLENDQSNNDLEEQLNSALEEVATLKTQGAVSARDIAPEVKILMKQREKLRHEADDSKVVHAVAVTQSCLPELETIATADQATLTRNRPDILQILNPLESSLLRIREAIGGHENLEES